MPRDAEYALGHSTREQRRLAAQGQLFRPSTEHVLRQAGIRPGLRVLDVGCGAGDVTFLVAELVGPTGAVVGVDRAPEVLESARQRAGALGLAQVRFVCADLPTFVPGETFDALVGRQVLLFQPNPVAVLRHLAAFVRDGGPIAFQEPLIEAHAWPRSALLERGVAWVSEALRRTGARPDMGLQLYRTFVDAGLPAPRLHMEGIVGGGPDSPVYGVAAETLRSLVPTIERLGLATAAELDIDTFEARLRAETLTSGGIISPVIQCGAWVRRPPA